MASIRAIDPSKFRPTAPALGGQPRPDQPTQQSNQPGNSTIDFLRTMGRAFGIGGEDEDGTTIPGTDPQVPATPAPQVPQRSRGEIFSDRFNRISTGMDPEVNRALNIAQGKAVIQQQLAERGASQINRFEQQKAAVDTEQRQFKRGQEIERQKIARLNATSTFLLRQKQLEALLRGGEPVRRITRGNVRTDTGMYDPSSITGVSDVDIALIPVPVSPQYPAGVKEIEIGRRPQAIRQQFIEGVDPRTGKRGKFPADPISGRLSGEAAVLSGAPTGLVVKGLEAAEGRNALKGLDLAYTSARSDFGIIESSRASAIKAKISAFFSTNEMTRDFRLAGIDSQRFLRFDVSRKRALNAYVKAQTGAQFSIKELDRYLTQFPLPWDDPETIQQQIAEQLAIMISRMNGLIASHQSLEGLFDAASRDVDIASIIDMNDLRRVRRKTPPTDSKLNSDKYVRP